MGQFSSVRFDRVLDPRERDDAARTLASFGAHVTSWSAAAGCTYAAAELPGATASETIAKAANARVAVPGLAVVRVRPDSSRRLPALAEAIGGGGRPAGIVDVRMDVDSVVVEFAPHTTPLAVVVALVDAELGRAAGRSIEPLLPLDDETLCAFASQLLAEPDLDATCLIETHLEPLLRASAARAV